MNNRFQDSRFDSLDATPESFGVREFASVGDAIDTILSRRSWTQADLAHVLAWPQQKLSDLANDRSSLRPDDALDLAEALGGTGADWMMLKVHQSLKLASSSRLTEERLTEIRQRSRVEVLLPTREMIRRGVLAAGSAGDLERSACELLEVRSLDEEIPFRASARRSDHTEPISRQQRAWTAEARLRLPTQLKSVAPHSKLGQLGQSLATTVRTIEEFQLLPHQFAEHGIGLVHIPQYLGGRIDGVCTVVDGHPLIAISGRGGRFDKVLFTIAHELAHVTLGHLNGKSIFISKPEDSDGIKTEPEISEIQADLCAGHWLLPDFGTIEAGPFTVERIKQFADQRGVHPGLVIGRLQREGRIPWNSRLNSLIPSVKGVLATWN